MRRKRAATSCLASEWRVSQFLVLLTLLKSVVVVYGAENALTVTTAEALRDAFLDQNVSAIYLGQDIALSTNVWLAGLEETAKHGIVLDRNLTLITHPALPEPAVLFLDYMQHKVLAGDGVYLKIDGVVMTGVSRDARNLFFVPFFQFLNGGVVFIQNSQFQLAIDPDGLYRLEDYPSTMNGTERPAGYEDWPVETFLIPAEQCAENTLRQTTCGDGAVLVASLSARLTVFDLNGAPVGKAAFLALNVLMVAEVVTVGPQQRVNVSDALEFKKALQNPLIKEIMLQQDLRLSKDVFPPSIRTPITRNVTIASAPTLGRRAIVDLDFLKDAVVAGTDVQITLQDLNFTCVSDDLRRYELVPFFSLRQGGSYVYRRIVSEMAVSSEEAYPLHQLPALLYGGEHEFVSAVSAEWCDNDGRIACPDGALYVKRGERRLQVRGVDGQKAPEEGMVYIEDSLIKAVNITEKSEITIVSRCKEIPTVLAQESRQNAASDEEEERKSFGLMGGFDPWILIYVLVAAALFLGVCLFVTILRRRRDQKELKKNASMKSLESAPCEDDGMHAHQKVARQLLGDVKLGSLLGFGSFGRVYKAMWSGAQVAVKVILHQEDEAEVVQEARFSMNLRHPNVVQTFNYAMRMVETATPTPKAGEKAETTVVNINCKAASCAVPVAEGMNIPSSWMKSSNGGAMFKASAASGSEKSSAIRTETESQSQCYTEERWMEMWLIQEFCNLGSLGKQNHLRVNDQNSAWGCKTPEMHVIIDTCKDIARGMKYLHDNGIVHGDLKCDNILLQTSHMGDKGFTAKVADFGLSRKLGTSTHLSTKSFGTITHMPPELLLDGHLSSKVDVYSFGIIMWELVTGLQPFRDLRYAEVMRAIVVDDRRPVFDPSTQGDYAALARRCWDRNPTKRPSFGAVLTELDKMSASHVQDSSFDSSAGSWSSRSESDLEYAASNKGYSA